jgi:hypothetical protein
MLFEIFNKLTVIDSAERLQSSAGAHEDDAAALGLLLHVVKGQAGGVDEAPQANVEQLVGRLLELTLVVRLQGQVVGAGADASVGKDAVDAAMVLLGLLEERAQVLPLGDVRLDEQQAGRLGRRRVDVAADDGRSQ